MKEDEKVASRERERVTLGYVLTDFHSPMDILVPGHYPQAVFLASSHVLTSSLVYKIRTTIFSRLYGHGRSHSCHFFLTKVEAIPLKAWINTRGRAIGAIQFASGISVRLSGSEPVFQDHQGQTRDMVCHLELASGPSWSGRPDTIVRS